MIARLLIQRLTARLFSTAGPKVTAGPALADLPNIEYPTKPKPEHDEQLPMNVAYETLSTTPPIQTISGRINYPTAGTLP